LLPVLQTEPFTKHSLRKLRFVFRSD